MNLQHRIDLLSRLGEYILSADEQWKLIREKASQENNWFIPEFIEHATRTIANSFLEKKILEGWVGNYQSVFPDSSHETGIVMAGNIPLAGFHDWLSVFISGHRAAIKLSSKDRVLLKHFTEKIIEWDERAADKFRFGETLKGCDAYIATGSNNSSRYFEYYFGKYPHIIRRNRTSVAILEGNESLQELDALADDVFLYFGLGCRNVTHLFVPEDYDFIPLLAAFKKYSWMIDHHKYKNNYDYNLAILLLNKNQYMTNGSVLLNEDTKLFSPISVLHYSAYSDKKSILDRLAEESDLQCIVGKGFVPFGQAQTPSISDHADGVDTLAFLRGLEQKLKNQ
jgi:hypothetical protein